MRVSSLSIAPEILILLNFIKNVHAKKMKLTAKLDRSKMVS